MRIPIAIAVRILWTFGLLGLVIALVHYYSLPSESISANPDFPTTTVTMAAAALKFIALPAVRNHTATVIFLHGLGDKGSNEQGWQQLVDMFQRDRALGHVKWILPDAPDRSITVNGGMQMPAWFDIIDIPLAETAVDDEAGILKSVEQVNELISAEVESGTLPNRIVLGGFSQGGVISLVTGLTGERKLAGLMGLSTWLPLRNKLKILASPHASSIPVFLGHGSADPVVNPHLAQVSAEFLTSSVGIPKSTSADECKGLTLNMYPGMGHSTVPKEMEDVKQWLKQTLPA